jgi:ATP-dependent RNA helicase RhlE
MSFSTFQLDPRLLRGVADLGFTQPTPIQRDGLPPALAGRDLLACAMTGSGKTAVFALSILQRLLSGRGGTTRALVLAPTRELAAQIVAHFNDLGRHSGLQAAAVYGGVGMAPQERALRRGVDVVVACPGRLLDHMQYPYARFADLEVLVLDEADRMLDMGFLPDIRRVLEKLPPRAQTMLFSATVPAPIVALSRQLLRQPAVLNVERPPAPATGVRQAVYQVRQELKSQLVLALLASKAEGAVESALVFTRTKHRANRLAQFLQRHGVPCERIHGNRSQAQRTQALEGFKQRRFRVLVATDVAARGIDIEGLSHVINFDVPNLAEDYIHRVGRTACAGASGEALTLASPQEGGELRAIERAVGKSLPRRTVDGFDYQAGATETLEIPIAERIAAIRARKSEERARARANAERKARTQAERPAAGDGGGRHPHAAGPGRARPAAPPHRVAHASPPAAARPPGESWRRRRGGN